MIPDLGKYAAEVLSAYAVSILLLLGLVWISVRAARRARATLEAVERQKAARNG
ncbi:MAG: heme exporter protein CcmD [Salibaculum sp.]|jgi:heme exporter protein D|uniref:heme exporter protein CcmD n=1 Tax=Roseovarius halophilus (ex Wu et al. 2025) TaxID=3376060 RepID=UPI0028703FE0|nr:heme exporter protein CcmD [Salibaculum sp.]MDR9428727.1 heme exporter protein CcmD [Salibaculum sp.]MDR9483114.1 heme exporter protein CcmD [Salibaculum sp.]